MLKSLLTPIAVMALCITGAITGVVGQDYGSGVPRGPYNNTNGPQQAQNWPPNNQYNGQRYTTVTVTNRGQNGYPDQVVQQQVPCGSQYYDGYRQRIAPRC